MSQESVVYLVQEPPLSMRNGEPVTKDLTSAQRYGIIKALLSQKELASRSPAPYYNKMVRELKDFDPANDYICFSGGDSMAIGLAVLALRNMNFKEIKFLRWERERSADGSRSSGYYIPQILPLY